MTNNKKMEILFLHTAVSGTITKGKDDKNFKLVLENIANKTIWFADRPDRKAGTVNTEIFVNDWSKGNNSFKKDNPNAALTSDSLKNGKNLPVADAITLSNPVYDDKNHSLTYDCQVINGETMHHKVGKHNNMVLFIDGILSSMENEGESLAKGTGSTISNFLKPSSNNDDVSTNVMVGTFL